MSEPTPPPEPIGIQPEISPKPTPESRPAKPKLSLRAKIGRLLTTLGLGAGAVGGGGYVLTQTDLGRQFLEHVIPAESMDIALSEDTMTEILGILPTSTAGQQPTAAPVLAEATSTPTISPTETEFQPEQTEESTLAETTGREVVSLWDLILGGDILANFIEARHERVAAMSEADKEAYFELIGGEEQLDAPTITIALLGMDANGRPEGRVGSRADQIHILRIDTRTLKIDIASVNRDVMSPEMDGDPINTVTWYDQKKLTQGISEFYPQELIESTLENISGEPIDGVIQFNFNSFITLIDNLFPEGVTITIGEGEGFELDTQFILEERGSEQVYQQTYEAGQSYTLTGQKLLDFVRSRKTSSTFSREDKAGDVIVTLLSLLANQALEDPVSFISNLPKLFPTIEQLEAAHDLAMQWDVDVPYQGQEVPVNLSQYMRIIWEALKNFMSNPAVMTQVLALAESTPMPSQSRTSMVTNPEQDMALILHRDARGDKFLLTNGQGVVTEPIPANARNYWGIFRRLFQGNAQTTVSVVDTEPIPLAEPTLEPTPAPEEAPKAREMPDRQKDPRFAIKNYDAPNDMPTVTYESEFQVKPLLELPPAFEGAAHADLSFTYESETGEQEYVFLALPKTINTEAPLDIVFFAPGYNVAFDESDEAGVLAERKEYLDAYVDALTSRGIAVMMPSLQGNRLPGDLLADNVVDPANYADILGEAQLALEQAKEHLKGWNLQMGTVHVAGVSTGAYPAMALAASFHMPGVVANSGSLFLFAPLFPYPSDLPFEYIPGLDGPNPQLARPAVIPYKAFFGDGDPSVPPSWGQDLKQNWGGLVRGGNQTVSGKNAAEVAVAALNDVAIMIGGFTDKDWARLLEETQP